MSRRTGDESGATIIFIAVVLLGLLAMAAFAIDFGRIWQERRELQLGATAGALAVGEDCARNLCAGGYNELSTAEAYADANASDGAASVFAIDLDLAAQTVAVTTATENAAGGDTFDMLFARIVGFDTITVGADAAVAWGVPLNAATMPLIISTCEWDKPAPWPAGTPGSLPMYSANLTLTLPKMVTITFHAAPATEQCNAQAGQDADGNGKLPGGFGWLDATSACEAVVSQGQWIGADPGSSPSNGCSASELEDLLFGEPVLIPYFYDLEGQGNNGQYLVEGHGAFVVAGYNFGGQYKEFRAPLSGLPCSGSTRCLAGWFVQYVDNGGGPGDLGGNDFGATVVKLIG